MPSSSSRDRIGAPPQPGRQLAPRIERGLGPDPPEREDTAEAALVEGVQRPGGEVGEEVDDEEDRQHPDARPDQSAVDDAWHVDFRHPRRDAEEKDGEEHQRPDQRRGEVGDSHPQAFAELAERFARFPQPLAGFARGEEIGELCRDARQQRQRAAAEPDAPCAVPPRCVFAYHSTRYGSGEQEQGESRGDDQQPRRPGGEEAGPRPACASETAGSPGRRRGRDRERQGRDPGPVGKIGGAPRPAGRPLQSPRDRAMPGRRPGPRGRGAMPISGQGDEDEVDQEAEQIRRSRGRSCRRGRAPGRSCGCAGTAPRGEPVAEGLSLLNRAAFGVCPAGLAHSEIAAAM